MRCCEFRGHFSQDITQHLIDLSLPKGPGWVSPPEQIKELKQVNGGRGHIGPAVLIPWKCKLVIRDFTDDAERLTVIYCGQTLIKTCFDTWGPLLLLLWAEVEFFGEHGGEAGHLFLPDSVWVGGEPDAPHGHLPVDQRQQLCEFQGGSILVEEVTQILDVPGAVHNLPVGVVTLTTEHGGVTYQWRLVL